MNGWSKCKHICTFTMLVKNCLLQHVLGAIVPSSSHYIEMANIFKKIPCINTYTMSTFLGKLTQLEFCGGGISTKKHVHFLWLLVLNILCFVATSLRYWTPIYGILCLYFHIRSISNSEHKIGNFLGGGGCIDILFSIVGMLTRSTPTLHSLWVLYICNKVTNTSAVLVHRTYKHALRDIQHDTNYAYLGFFSWILCPATSIQ